jgi:G3E family GTPase
MRRYKGVLNVAGLGRRLVFQGVHMIFSADLGAPWRAIAVADSLQPLSDQGMLPGP